MNRKYLKLFIVVDIAIVLLVGFWLYTKTDNDTSITNTSPSSSNSTTKPTSGLAVLEEGHTLDDGHDHSLSVPVDALGEIDKNTPPISNSLSRMTKKFFGTYVTPQNSPVSPERFTGFHTGLDFETTEAEQNIDVPVSAICYGKLLTKTTGSGYGGYVVQSCTINDKAVTVVYGHLRLSSITAKVGDELKAGDEIGVLGTGYSEETDGERKHLHLGIHIGSEVNIAGYLTNENALSGWMNPKTILGY